MTYIICIVLLILVIVFALHYYFLKREISSAIKQMKEIRKYPQRNRQLKAVTTNFYMEELLKQINFTYDERQKERIIYQRRESQIRREIENISHDLRTPLASIIGYVELIQDQETTELERQEYTGIIKERARILQGFIQDFYELSRIEGDDYPILLDALNVHSSLKEAFLAYYFEFEKRNIQVDIKMEEKSCYIIADKIQFNRILNNLIQNGLKYSDSTFLLKQYSTNEECIMLFQNDHSKMTQQDLTYIFDRFYTGDMTRNNHSTGLGLTITKLLVEKMNGRIEVRLEEDLFTIEIRWKINT